MCGDHSEANVHNGHQDEEEVKLVPAIAPVAAPSQAGDLDGSLNYEDCCEAVVAVLLGIGEGCGLIVDGGSQDDNVDHNDCCDDVVEGLQTGPKCSLLNIDSSSDICKGDGVMCHSCLAECAHCLVWLDDQLCKGKAEHCTADLEQACRTVC